MTDTQAFAALSAMHFAAGGRESAAAAYVGPQQVARMRHSGSAVLYGQYNDVSLIRQSCTTIFRFCMDCVWSMDASMFPLEASASDARTPRVRQRNDVDMAQHWAGSEGKGSH